MSATDTRSHAKRGHGAQIYLDHEELPRVVEWLKTQEPDWARPLLDHIEDAARERSQQAAVERCHYTCPTCHGKGATAPNGIQFCPCPDETETCQHGQPIEQWCGKCWALGDVEEGKKSQAKDAAAGSKLARKAAEGKL